MELRLATEKHKAIQSFLQFGIPERPTSPRLAVIYPPIDRRYLKEDKPDEHWLQRLMPDIIFEDMKALQKIEKTLRLIGFTDFRIFNNRSIPADVHYMNRIWLCLPRNQPAQANLELYKDASKFRLIARTPKHEARFLWRNSLKSSEFIEITSPLSKYLKEQREGIDVYDWSSELGRIIAKDYAVIARFSYEGKDVAMEDGKIKDYFIAGIRGLGTWGAGWYIDRKHNEIAKKCEQNENVQILLEVTYKDERILDVCDVSDKPEKYFKEQNSIKTIRHIIDEYKTRLI
jgi:hypothetical protein